MRNLNLESLYNDSDHQHSYNIAVIHTQGTCMSMVGIKLMTCLWYPKTFGGGGGYITDVPENVMVTTALSYSIGIYLIHASTNFMKFHGTS